MDNSIAKAINLAQRLRAVMLQVVAAEKEIEEYEDSEEYMQSIVSDFNEDWSKSDDLAAAWGKMSDKQRQAYFKKRDKLNKKSRSKRIGKKLATRPTTSLKEQDATEASTAILSMIDQLLYALMNTGGDEGWADEADYEERTQMKLKEIMRAV